MAHVHDIERYSTPPTIADLEAVAREAFAGVPGQLRRFVQNVVIRVEDFPDDETLEDLECDSPFDLLGLYRGHAEVDLNQAILKGLTIKGIYGREMFDTWYKATAMLRSGLDVTPVITHRFPLDRYEEAFAALRSGSASKVILEIAP